MEDITTSLDNLNITKEKVLYYSVSFNNYRDIMKIVCDICGLFAQRSIKKENKNYPQPSDVYDCPACRNKTKISRIIIPYAFKLLIQELMSMNITPRIRTLQYTL